MTDPTIGLAVGAPSGVYAELTDAVERAARESGRAVCRVADARAAGEADVVLALGYPHYYPWLAAATSLPVRVAWIGEPLPPAHEPIRDTVRRQLPMGRLVDAVSRAATLGHRRPEPSRLLDWRERATVDHIERVNLAIHRRAARQGIRFIETSTDRAASMHRAGIAAAAVPFGYHPAFAGEPQDVADDARDIDVLVFGTGMADRRIRRARLLAAIERELGPGVRVQVVHDAWGLARMQLLGRSRVVLNINAVPGNFIGIRALLVGAAGAVCVTDPMATPEPFVPGVHYLEASDRELAGTVRSILADRPRRLEMARAAQRFLVEELTMARSLDAVLEYVA